MLIHDYLHYYARNFPDAPCVSQGDLTLSYAGLEQSSNQVANGLVDLGVGPGQRVAILGENSFQHYQLFMAVSKMAAVSVPLNYRLAPAELAFIINDAEVKVLLVLKGQEAVLQALRPLLPKDITVFGHGVSGCEDFTDWFMVHRSEKPEVPVQDNDGLIQLYTSGTTGNPKGVVNSHRNVIALAMMSMAGTAHRSNVGSCGIVCAPLFHIGGAGSLFLAIHCGQHALLHKQFDPAKVLDDVENHTVTSVFLVPAMIAAILQVPGAQGRDFSKLQQVSYGASPISETLLRRALEVFQCDFIQAYGMTETTGTVVTLSADDHRKALAGQPELLRCAGRPTVSTQVKVISADGDEVPTGEIGEITVKSESNMLGYFNLPQETAKTLQDGWVRTGDAGYIDEAGYVYLKDRIKDMVVSGGENIYPVEVENAIAKHQSIIDVAVIGVPDDKFGEALLAFVVLATDATLTTEALIDFCRDKIAGFKIPRQMEIIDELPRNPSGKVLKKILRQPYWAEKTRNIG